MQDNETIILTPTPDACETGTVMEPKNPSADLWDEMDKIQQEMCVGVRPGNSFTANEVAERYGICASAARYRIRAMIRAGRAKCVGGSGHTHTYYVLIGTTDT